MIRPANPRDAQRIAMLMHQLGYDVPAEELARRLQRQPKRCETRRLRHLQDSV